MSFPPVPKHTTDRCHNALKGYWMRLIATVVIICIFPTVAFPSGWAEVNGIQLGMLAAKAKSKGFTDCTPPSVPISKKHFHALQVETCRYVGKLPGSFYGEVVRNAEITNYSGKVESITLITTNNKGNFPYLQMRRKYGAPRRIREQSVLWERGLENVELTCSDGGCKIWAITFAYFPKD